MNIEKVLTKQCDDNCDVDDNRDMIDEGSQPLCVQCLTPVEPLQHYCSTCGGTVGIYTRCIPFVNIPFQVEFYGNIWKKFWRDDISVLYRIGLLPIVIVCWGPLFLVGMPFEIWRKYKNIKR